MESTLNTMVKHTLSKAGIDLHVARGLRRLCIKNNATNASSIVLVNVVSNSSADVKNVM